MGGDEATELRLGENDDFFMKFDMMQLGVLLYKSCDLMFILFLENRAKIGTWAVSKPIILNLKLKLRRDS